MRQPPLNCIIIHRHSNRATQPQWLARTGLVMNECVARARWWCVCHGAVKPLPLVGRAHHGENYGHWWRWNPNGSFVRRRRRRRTEAEQQSTAPPRPSFRPGGVFHESCTKPPTAWCPRRSTLYGVLCSTHLICRRSINVISAKMTVHDRASYIVFLTWPKSRCAVTVRTVGHAMAVRRKQEQRMRLPVPAGSGRVRACWIDDRTTEGGPGEEDGGAVESKRSLSRHSWRSARGRGEYTARAGRGDRWSSLV